MSDDKGKHKERLLWPAVDHWLTGLVFACLLSAAVVAGAKYIPFMEEIEALGVDASMRFNAELLSDAPDKHSVGYAFVDLDAATCMEATGGDRLCERRSPASGAAAARVALALLSRPPPPGPGEATPDEPPPKPPRLIVLDVRLWESDPKAPAPPVLKELLKVAAASGVPILAPAPAAPADACLTPARNCPMAAPNVPCPAEGATNCPAISIDWMEAPEELRTGPIKFAPAITQPDPADGVVRNYPAHALAAVFDGDGDLANPRQVVATLPFLASAYVDPKHRALADCLAGLVLIPPAKPCAIPTAVTSEAETRLLFKMLPADRSDRRTPSEANQLYQYFRSSGVVASDGKLLIDKSRIADKVVVVGYGGPSGLDRHVTPIGEMSGAELILNSIRSFAEFDTILPEPLGQKVRREVASAIISSIPFLVFWLVKGWLWRWAGTSKWRRWPAFAAAAAAFAATTLTAALGTTLIISQAGRLFPASDQPFDVLLPILILALESFADVAKFAIDRLHHFITHWRQRLIPLSTKAEEASHERA